MEYVIQPDDKDKIIKVRATGKWDLEFGRAMSREIAETVDATHLRLVLVDMRKVEIRASIIQIYERVKELWDEHQSAKQTVWKVAAVLTLDDQEFKKEMQFFENTAQNRGLPYRIFSDMDEAFIWLTNP
ncbi:MAG: hypothetical protein HS100_03685 [Anaerolineales bacterium]|nr:hypothetical protein [Anaerolineales bacterium]